MKYSPEDSDVKVFAQKGKGCIVIWVADHGAGISPDDQAALFEPFQGSGKPVGLRGGVGLGLVVCKRLAEAHGGRVWVDSGLGCGSTFFCELPLPGRGK